MTKKKKQSLVTEEMILEIESDINLSVKVYFEPIHINNFRIPNKKMTLSELVELKKEWNDKINTICLHKIVHSIIDGLGKKKEFTYVTGYGNKITLSRKNLNNIQIHVNDELVYDQQTREFWAGNWIQYLRHLYISSEKVLKIKIKEMQLKKELIQQEQERQELITNMFEILSL